MLQRVNYLRYLHGSESGPSAPMLLIRLDESLAWPLTLGSDRQKWHPSGSTLSKLSLTPEIASQPRLCPTQHLTPSSNAGNQISAISACSVPSPTSMYPRRYVGDWERTLGSASSSAVSSSSLELPCKHPATQGLHSWVVVSYLGLGPLLPV